MRQLHATLFLAAIAIAASACGGSEPPPQTPEAPPNPPPVAAPTAPPPPAAAPAPPPTASVAPPADKPAETADRVPGANLTVGGMEVDGVVVETLSCKVSGLGLLGAMVVAGTLAKQRPALRACGLKAPVPVGWTIRGGSVSDADASSGDAKKDACIVKALRQIKSTDDGVCRAKVGLK